ncbi:shikimate dehydrogenase [Bacillus sp. AGMB 02131]|uniref:Shikimate dehydrogenase (NADP(+)) n=1 Tax=Peribacillus faecalis TaxID=2772559 RepID=A0A927CXZ2_9BACI|nr:shikimate dehydrogenase [Peribacillus faecalis]MBD3107745.1 shikimate dehydrogenase [Peribacillus faecalis]
MADQGRIDGRTKLLGLLATPIGHSLSPAMHNMSLRKLGLNYAYMAFEVGNQQLADVVTGMRALEVRGFNVSMPNKTKILPLLDELSPAAQFAGAVNTVVNENGKLVGHITDGTGYMRGLKEAGIDVVGKKMVLMGAGGAATAIAIQAALDGVAEIAIFNRDDEFYARAEKNVQIINEEMKDVNCKATVHRLEDEEALKAAIAEADILTNGTGVGMKPLQDECLIPDASWLRPELIVTDVVYIPRKTKLLEMAEGVGCKTLNGLGMMLWQGARAFEMWTGEEMPVEYVKEQMF